MKTSQKDGSENKDTKVVKDKNEKNENYIFQNTKIAKTGLIIIVVFLVLCAIGVIASGVILGDN